MGTASRSSKAQSAMEYLVTYGWAILIIAIVVSLLYLYVIVPSTVVPSTCSFVSGAYCNNIIVGTNLQTHLTKLAVFLTNTQSYPLSNPMLIVRTANTNSSAYACSPSFVLAGGSVVCTVTLPVQTSLSQFLAGSFYLTGTYCGLSSNYSITHKCTGTVQTYSGTFTSHVQPLINTNNIVLFTAQNTTNPANNAKDPLRATVLLLGYPLRGATVNFTENVPSYKLQPNLTTTNSTGVALSYIWGTRTGNVVVNAVYAGISNSVTIQFTPPTYIFFSTSGFAYCGQDSATMVVIDGTPYTCAQWTSSQLACGAGSSHTYNFSQTVSISSSIRQIFNKVTVNGVSSTSNHSTIICPATNGSIIANYTTQFYLTETANPPAGAATLTPGSNWYNNGSIQTLSETANSGYFFQTWSCTGTGCYTGALTSTSLPVNAVISETANYYSTTSTSTTSTSTSTTSTSTSTSTTSTSTSTSTTSTTTTTIPANPSCGAFVGSVTYSSSTTLTCNVIASGSITVNNGVTIDEHGYYMQANSTFTNGGTITDLYAGGSGGSGGGGGINAVCNSATTLPSQGHVGSSGASRLSAHLSVTLTGGSGGGGGGGGGAEDNCNGVGGWGGNGGSGGGIVELYGGSIINNGVITVVGGNGVAGDNPAVNNPVINGVGYSGYGGGGGGGSGGNGGTVLLGYTTTLTQGSILVTGGSAGAGGAGDTGSYYNAGTQCFAPQSGNGGSNSGGGGGGSGGSTSVAYCYQYGGIAGAQGAGGACGGSAGAAPGNTPGLPGGNGCNGSGSSSSGQIVIRTWP